MLKIEYHLYKVGEISLLSCYLTIGGEFGKVFPIWLTFKKQFCLMKLLNFVRHIPVKFVCCNETIQTIQIFTKSKLLVLLLNLNSLKTLHI